MANEFIDSMIDDKESMRGSDALLVDGEGFEENSQRFQSLVGPALEMVAEKANKQKRSYWKESMAPVLDHRGVTRWVHQKHLHFYD